MAMRSRVAPASHQRCRIGSLRTGTCLFSVRPGGNAALDMADTTLIAVAGIAATALTGIASPSLTQWLSHRRDEAQRTHERAQDDIAELRSLVDETAQNVARALELYREVRSWLIQLGPHFDERATGSTQAFRSLGLQVDVDTTRLSIRLGRDHPLCIAHRRVAQAIVDVVQHVGIAVSMGDHADVLDAWNEVKKAGEDMYDAHDRFTEEAVAIVGSRLDQ